MACDSRWPQMSVVTAPFQPAFAQLLEDRRAEHGIVQRRSADAQQRIFVDVPGARLVGARHPQRQQAQDAARALEARQHLPFALEHRQHRRMERVGRQECLVRRVGREPTGQLQPVLQHPVGVGAAGVAGLPVQDDPAVLRHRGRVPLEQPAADDLGGLGLGRHHDRLAHPVEHLLEALLVGLVFGGVLQLRRGDRDDQHDVVLAARGLGERLEEVVHAVVIAQAPVGADVVDDLVDQDDRRPILGQERADHVPLRLDELRLVLAQHRQRLRAAELVGDLAPRRPAQRRAIVAAAAAQRVELGADEDRGGRLGDALQPGLRAGAAPPPATRAPPARACPGDRAA